MDRELEIKQRIALGLAAALHARNLPFAEADRLYTEAIARAREHFGTLSEPPSLLTLLAADYTADHLDLRALAVLETAIGYPVVSVPWARSKAESPRDANDIRDA